MFCFKIRCSQPFDFWTSLVGETHGRMFFFQMDFGQDTGIVFTSLGIRGLVFLCHEGRVFSLKFICSFLRFSFTKLWVLPSSSCTANSLLFSLSDGDGSSLGQTFLGTIFFRGKNLDFNYTSQGYQTTVRIPLWLGEDFHCTPGIPWKEGKFGNLG